MCPFQVKSIKNKPEIVTQIWVTVAGKGLSVCSNYLYRWESNLAIRLPQSKIIMYSFIWRTAIVYKIKEISSSVLGLSAMTPRECRVDRPFPDHVTR